MVYLLDRSSPASFRHLVTGGFLPPKPACLFRLCTTHRGGILFTRAKPSCWRRLCAKSPPAISSRAQKPVGGFVRATAISSTRAQAWVWVGLRARTTLNHNARACRTWWCPEVLVSPGGGGGRFADPRSPRATQPRPSSARPRVLPTAPSTDSSSRPLCFARSRQLNETNT